MNYYLSSPIKYLFVKLEFFMKIKKIKKINTTLQTNVALRCRLLCRFLHFFPLIIFNGLVLLQILLFSIPLHSLDVHSSPSISLASLSRIITSTCHQWRTSLVYMEMFRFVFICFFCSFFYYLYALSITLQLHVPFTNLRWTDWFSL